MTPSKKFTLKPRKGVNLTAGLRHCSSKNTNHYSDNTTTRRYDSIFLLEILEAASFIANDNNRYRTTSSELNSLDVQYDHLPGCNRSSNNRSSLLLTDDLLNFKENESIATPIHLVPSVSIQRQHEVPPPMMPRQSSSFIESSIDYISDLDMKRYNILLPML